jgi:hypothetical protein
MIKIENTVTPSPEQWEAIIRGMRNPKNSWDKSDSKTVNAVLTSNELIPGVETFGYEPCEPYFSLGEKDFFFTRCHFNLRFLVFSIYYTMFCSI